METREELLSGLNDAVSIFRQLSNIQQRLSQVRSQYRNVRPNKSMKTWIIIIAVLGVGECILNLTKVNIWGLIFAVLKTVVAYFVVKVIYNTMNKKIDRENEQINTNNGALQVQEQEVINDLQQVQIAYREKVSSWYPEKYCFVEAAEFFCDAIKNYRADSIKEAINLYENTLHQRRVEDNQKQAIKQQKLNNLLAVGSLAMQGAQLGEMSRQSAAMNESNKTLRDIHSQLRGY